jgi:L-lactate dehydrogenase complex protein LldF
MNPPAQRRTNRRGDASLPRAEPGPGLAKNRREKYPFTAETAKAASDDSLKVIMSLATLRQDTGRKTALGEIDDPLQVRTLGARIKEHTLSCLDEHLARLADSIERRGGHVHWACTGQDARDAIAKIAADANVKRIVKSKTMTAEEIHLNPFLEERGLEVVETDLGELILQLDEDRPSHLVAPVVHKNVDNVADIFHRKFGMDRTTDPDALTQVARGQLREKFATADMGIIGVNFAISETGTIVICTNEGNGRFCTSRPRVVVALMGMEKVIPSFSDLAVYLKLLARSSTGQRITVYTSMISGPRTEIEPDGPEEFHLIIMDNGRSRILASDYAETLRCIRCGACLNACPVYRKVGGHAYGTVYMGPIGKLLTPLFEGMKTYSDLPQASSLCGACYEACPVRINIPEMLIRMRSDINRLGHTPILLRWAMKAWAWTLRSQRIYEIGSVVQQFGSRLLAKDGWIRSLPFPVSGWTRSRDFLAPAQKSFRQMWKEENPN